MVIARPTMPTGRDPSLDIAHRSTTGELGPLQRRGVASSIAQATTSATDLEALLSVGTD